MPSRRENLQKLLEDVNADIEELRGAYGQRNPDGNLTITDELAGRLIGGVRDVIGILYSKLDLISPEGEG